MLAKFLLKNRGYIHIDSLETKEIIQKNGFDVDVEYLKRYFAMRFSRELEIRQAKAPFYKLLPCLEEALKDLLLKDLNTQNDNSYCIFFDDLDINYHSNSESDKKALLGLLRVAKHINNDFFGKNAINAKIVLLLRSDVAKALSGYAADSAKLLSSYAVSIDWCEDGYGRDINEADRSLKQFANIRIAYAFKKAGIIFDDNDPWSSLVSNDDFDISSFDYVVKMTLFRPRDIILFFKPLAEESYAIPLSRQDVNVLARKYADELATELKNELAAFYNEKEINGVFKALCVINANANCYYNVAVDILRQNCPSQAPEDLLADLFDRSIVGTLAANGHIYFRYREARGGGG